MSRTPEAPERAPSSNRNLAVLISGRGSNLQAIIGAIAAGRLDARLALVVSNRAHAPGLAHGRAAGAETLVLPHVTYSSRDEYDRAVLAELRSRDIRLVCLAGFMRVIGPILLNAYPRAILNVHPSLLPAFPGLDAQRQALHHGVKVSGATVHFVTEDLDGGPIVAQAAVDVRDDDSVETLSARILEQEHRIYPEAIQAVLSGGWHIAGRRVVHGPARRAGG